jgi:RNA ligase
VTRLSDILNVAELGDLVRQGYIRCQTHPTLPLRIYNYCDKTVHEGAWCLETRTSRGLIVDDDGIVRGRGLSKFFGLHEHESPLLPEIPWHQPFDVYSKADGSCGIGYPVNDMGDWAVATRGSFASDQAIHATRVLNERYRSFTASLGGTITPVWEILYPENRIVVNHGDFDDLVLLCGIEIRTGRSISPEAMVHALGWPGPVVEKHPARPIEELLAEDIPNAEGYVIHFPRSDFRVKAKFPSYLKLHRVLTHANSRTIWECLRTGVELPQIDGVPEFDAWLENQRTTLVDLYGETRRDAVRLLNKVHHLDDRKSQAQYLLANGDKTLMAIVFRMLDGKNFDDLIWKSIKPEYSLPFWSEVA